MQRVALALMGAPEGYGLALVKMLLALVFVCALAFVLLRYGLRRLAGGHRQSKAIQVVDRCSLSSGKTLWIARVGARHFLLGGSETGLSMLAELDGFDPAASSGAFRALVARERSGAGEDESVSTGTSETGEP